MDNAAQRLGVRPLHRLADAAKTERAQRVALTAVGAVGGLHLGDDERAHAGATSSASAGSAVPVASTGASAPLVSEIAGLPESPSTLSTDRPRNGLGPFFVCVGWGVAAR